MCNTDNEHDSCAYCGLPRTAYDDAIGRTKLFGNYLVATCSDYHPGWCYYCVYAYYVTDIHCDGDDVLAYSLTRRLSDEMRGMYVG